MKQWGAVVEGGEVAEETKKSEGRDKSRGSNPNLTKEQYNFLHYRISDSKIKPNKNANP